MRNANGFESILRGLLPNYIVPDNVAQVQE